MHDALRLTELLAARLCHDLSGLTTSLAGLLEEADDRDPAARAEATLLVTQTAAEMVARISLLRAAWGPQDRPLDAAALRTLAAGLPAARRVRVDLSGLAPAPALSAVRARLVLNLLLLGSEAMVGGGSVAVAGPADGDLLVTLSGPRAAWPEALRPCLASEAACFAALTDPRALQAPLTALLAHAAGARLSLLMASGGPAGPAPLLVTFT